MVTFDSVMDSVISYIQANGPTLLYALITLVVGWWIIKFVVIGCSRSFEKKKLDKSLSHFLSAFISIVLKIALLISVVSMIGIQTTSFIAIFAAGGLAVGLALQGSLSNFAGGVLILLIRPFKVGDYIEAQGYTGTVEKIEIFNTTLVTLDYKVIILPNGDLANSAVVNHYVKERRRVDIVFGISYEDDVVKAQKIILDLLKKDKRVLKDPEPTARITALADSSVNITMKAWATPEDMWGVYFDMFEKVKQEFDKAGITIPYPQRELHLIEKK